MNEIHPNRLLVEGAQEKRLIPELMKKNGVNWGSIKNPIRPLQKSGWKPELPRQDLKCGRCLLYILRIAMVLIT
jgi:hypothetical protein